MMVGREITNLYPRSEHAIGEVIFEAKHVTCWDVTNPERKRVDDVSFQLRKGEILGIAGLVGAGRTELVSAIFGAYAGRSVAELYMDGKQSAKYIENEYKQVAAIMKEIGLAK